MLLLNNTLCRLAILGILSSSYQSGYTDFAVESVTDPCDCAVYRPEINYGNAANCDFSKAINGCSAEMTADEYDDIASMVPIPDYNHWLIRFAVDQMTPTLSNIKNHSPSGSYETSIISTPKVKYKKSLVWDFAIGYTWKCWQAELEYFQPKSIRYDQDPVFSNLAVGLSSQIKSNVVFFNVYYNFFTYYDFKPYVALGIGGAAHTVDATVSGVDVSLQKTRTKFVPVGQGIIGIRYRLFSQLLVDVKYQYIYLGQVEWDPLNDKSFDIKGDYTTKGLGIGLVYWFDGIPFKGC